MKFTCRLLAAAVLALNSNGLAAAPPQPPPSFPPVGPEPLNYVSENALVLHDGWRMQAQVLAGADGAAISRPGVALENWCAAAVPTTVLGALVRQGVYPDPYVGANNMLIPDASDDHNRRYDLAKFSHLPDKSNPWSKPWWFRTEFDVPERFSGKVVWLNLDGLNYRADIWLNGQRLADSRQVAGMFQRFHFDITALALRGRRNVLAVRVYPLDHPGDPVHEQLDGLSGSFGPNGGDGEILRNVTQYCAIGWDWVPAARDRNMGLWQHVWLEATGPVVARDPAAFTAVRLPGGGEAALTLRCHLENADNAPRAAEVLVRIEPDGFAGEPVVVRTNVVLSPREMVELKLTPQQFPALLLKKPRLWWPVTYGEQPLYQLTIETRVSGEVSSRVGRRFGVRSVGSFLLPSGGRAFTVNGRTLRLTGGAWIPDFLMSWSAQRYRHEIRLMAEGNHTVVRVNGCGIIPPDVFFDTCDRLGIMVWEDLSRTSLSGDYRKDGRKGWYPVDCDEPSLWLANMKDCVVRLRGHPSLLVWCGSNEAPPQESLGAAMQNEILPALDGARPWLPSSSEKPPWASEPMGIWTGGPWQMVRLPEYFRLYAQDPKFTARDEIGLASPPPLNSLVRFLPDHNQPERASFPLNRTMSYHDATSVVMRSSDDILRADLGEPSCLAEYLWMSDLYNGAAYRAIFEAANKARPRNAGTHLWKVNAAWPSFMWQVFDWALRPNAGYYSMKSACQPLHIQHSADDHALQVVSTLAETRSNLTLRVTLADATGRIEHREQRGVTAVADATTPAGSVADRLQDGRLRFLVLELHDAQGREWDRSATFVQRDCRFHELLKLPPATVEARLLQRREEGAETVFRFSVVNTSRVPAVNVWLALLRGAQGEELLPVFWSDNAWLLLAGERRELTARCRTGLLREDKPHLMVEGWNVPPQDTDLVTGQPAPLQLEIVRSEVVRSQPNLHLSVTVTRQGAAGPRWTTWPLPVRVDGQVARYVRIGARHGIQSGAQLALLGLSPGEHRFRVGDGPDRTFTVQAASETAPPRPAK